jgi:hypothetical protein
MSLRPWQHLLSKAVFRCQSAAAFHRPICSLTRAGPASEILPKPNLALGNAAIYWAPVVPVTLMVWLR